MIFSVNKINHILNLNTNLNKTKNFLLTFLLKSSFMALSAVLTRVSRGRHFEFWESACTVSVIHINTVGLDDGPMSHVWGLKPKAARRHYSDAKMLIYVFVLFHKFLLIFLFLHVIIFSPILLFFFFSNFLVLVTFF